MAAISFEAYLEPTRGIGYRDQTINGVTTQYLSREFVLSSFSALVEVTVRRGANLTASDPTGRSDPYVVASCDESSHETQWKLQTLNPTWDETFALWIPSGSDTAERLLFRVRDKDFLSSDDDLGLAYVPLSELEPEKAVEMVLPLKGPSAGQGNISVALRLLPFMDDSANVEAALDAVSSADAKVVPGAPQAAKDLAALEEEGLTSAEVGASQLKQAWSALSSVLADGLLSIERVAYIEAPETDSQVWIQRDTTRKRVIVAFRGTEQVKWKDIATDVNLLPADLNIEGSTSERSVIDKLIKRQEDPMVHKGFFDAWISVRQRVIRVVDMVTGADSNWEVFVTGHSLGGALATLAAYTFAQRTSVRNKVTMYNYGSPRVGNKAFANEFAKLVPNSWRVHNADDVVAAVPRLLGYCHVPNGVRIIDGNKLVMLSTGLDVLGEGQSVTEAIEKLGEDVKQEATRSGALEAILEHEMKLLNDLKGGQALAQHLEDQYLEALCAVISEAKPSEQMQAAIARVRESVAEYRALLAAREKADK